MAMKNKKVIKIGQLYFMGSESNSHLIVTKVDSKNVFYYYFSYASDFRDAPHWREKVIFYSWIDSGTVVESGNFTNKMIDG
jgi:hypothetical protein